VVIVCTVRALKMHGGGPKVTPGKPLATAYTQENVELVKKGLCNLEGHLEVVRKFGLPAVVCINAFPTDTDSERQTIREGALKGGAFDAVVSTNWANGGEGAAKLAEAVDKAASQPSKPVLLYSSEMPLKDKISRLATEVYGADSVSYSPDAEKALASFSDLGYAGLPICMAKTQYSFSHDPNWKGRPKGYVFPITDVRLAAGAGFIYPLSGEINTMPGLGSKPGYIGMDIDTTTGMITGLS
jgi:formyltetrahydrofolate synthetase